MHGVVSSTGGTDAGVLPKYRKLIKYYIGDCQAILPYKKSYAFLLCLLLTFSSVAVGACSSTCFRTYLTLFSLVILVYLLFSVNF